MTAPDPTTTPYRVVSAAPEPTYHRTERAARLRAALLRDAGSSRDAPPIVEVYDPEHPAAFGGWRVA